MHFPVGSYITSVDTFRFRERFIELTDQQLAIALQVINAQFSGVYRLWRTLPANEREAKRELCISYLVAWQLAQQDPANVINLSGTGAIPLKSKKVGPISITYRDSVRQDGSMLEALTTNEFGIQAMLMIQTAPENYLLFT